jgi:hypothetical protein
MILLNILILVIAIGIAVRINSSYIQPALKNAQRFQLFRLRYRLHYLAMKGVISEDSSSYTVLLDLMNKSIRASASFKVTDFLIFVSRLPDDKKLATSVAQITSAIRENSSYEYCEIASEYFEALRAMMKEDTRLLFAIIRPLLAVMSSIAFFNDVKDEIQRRVSKVETAYSKLEQYKDDFSQICSC